MNKGLLVIVLGSIVILGYWSVSSLNLSEDPHLKKGQILCYEKTPAVEQEMFLIIQKHVDECNLFAKNVKNPDDMVCKLSLRVNGTDNVKGGEIVLKEVYGRDVLKVSGQYRILTMDEALSDFPWCKE